MIFPQDYMYKLSPWYYLKLQLLFYQVSFRGETGIDAGGLEKEFWTLLSKEILRRYFEGEEGNAVVKRDSSSLTVRKNSKK